MGILATILQDTYLDGKLLEKVRRLYKQSLDFKYITQNRPSRPTGLVGSLTRDKWLWCFVSIVVNESIKSLATACQAVRRGGELADGGLKLGQADHGK